MSRKKLWIGLGVVLIIAVFIIVNLRKGRSGGVAVQVEAIKRGNITQTVSGSGKIKPEIEVKISANVSAEIIQIFVKEGDHVTKGKLLVELDRTRYLATLDQARSNQKSAEANLMKARSDFKRAKALYQQKLSAEAELENIEANLKMAESEVERATATLKQTEDDLAKTRLYAPLNGTVTQLNKEVGEIALGSMFQADVIMVVADLSRMEVVAEVDENDVVLVSIGDSASIEVDAIPDTAFRGIVAEIAHTATTRGYGTQEEVTNFEVRVALVDRSEKIRTGMSATVDIKTETHKNVLHIPIQAVTVRSKDEVAQQLKGDTTEVATKAKTQKKDASPADTSSAFAKGEMQEVIFIVKDSKAELVPIKTGISDETNIEIISDLKEGVEVITGNYRALSKTLKHGTQIKTSTKTEAKVKS